MKTACAWEKFQGATLSLARSAPLKERLADAYRNHLCDVCEDDLPDEMRDQFRACSCALTRERPLSRGDDAIRASLRKMSCDEAERIASSIVLMFCALPRTPALRGLNGNGSHAGHVVPLYLAEA